RFEERLRHPVRRPRLLRPGLQHESDLQGDHGQPQRVNAGRVRRQHETDDGALGLVTDGDVALDAVAVGQHVEREAACQRREDAPHLGKHERVLLHVRAAHAFGQAGRRRLRADELAGRLPAVAHRQRAGGVEPARVGDARDQLVDGHAAKHLARARRLAHVTMHESRIRATDLGDRLARREMDDRVDVDAVVRLAPAENRDSQYTPTRVVDANPWKGRTPLTPSHGYAVQGGSRSPSSRSRKPGMKNSLVSVVRRTRPVRPYSTIFDGSLKSTTSMTARGCGAWYVIL